MIEVKGVRNLKLTMDKNDKKEYFLEAFVIEDGKSKVVKLKGEDNLSHKDNQKVHELAKEIVAIFIK